MWVGIFATTDIDMHECRFILALALSLLGNVGGCSVYDASLRAGEGDPRDASGPGGAANDAAGAGVTGGGIGGASGAPHDGGSSGAAGSTPTTGTGGSGGASGSSGAGGMPVADAAAIDVAVDSGPATGMDADLDSDASASDAGPIDAGDDGTDVDDDANDVHDEGGHDVAIDTRDAGFDPTTAASVRIIATYSDKCMGVDGNGTVDGTRIYQFPCGAASGQIFRFESQRGSYRIINPSSGKCIAASGTGNGASLHISACNGSPTQSYTLQSAGGQYSLVNSGAGNCVEIAGPSTTDGAAFRFYTCNGQSHQVFRFEAP